MRRSLVGIGIATDGLLTAKTVQRGFWSVSLLGRRIIIGINRNRVRRQINGLNFFVPIQNSIERLFVQWRDMASI